MFQAPANTASPVEPAARADFASRRQPRATNAAQEEGFAAILDRAGAQRADALRQLRQIEEPAVDGPAIQSGDATTEGIAHEPYKKFESSEPRVQQSKSQRRTLREGDDAGAGDGDVAPSTAQRAVQPETAGRADGVVQALPEMASDIPPLAPSVAQPALMIAAAQPVPPPTQMQTANSASTQSPASQAGTGGPTAPASVAPIPTPPSSDTSSPFPMGPTAPGEPGMPPSPAPSATQPTAPATATAPASPQPALPPGIPPQPTAPITAAPPPEPVRKPDAVLKPTSDNSGDAPRGAVTAPPPTLGPVPPAVETLIAPQPRAENAPAGLAPAAAFFASVETPQPQRSPITKTDMPPLAGDDASVDATIELPLVAVPPRGPAGEDPAAAGRGAMNRGTTSTGNALAAQLAQNEDGVPPAAMAAPPSVIPTPADTGRFGADTIESRAAAKQDDVAPVRHAIVAPPEAAAARIETTVETLATRTARMPMHPAVAQVAVSVTKAAQEGVDRITIKLQPPELGRIDVRLEVGIDGRIQAVFAAERPATVEILQRDVRELERALQNAGLSTDAGSLSFGLKQNGGQNGGAFSAFERNLGNNLAGTAEEETAPAARPKRAAIDGRLDIHV